MSGPQKYLVMLADTKADGLKPEFFDTVKADGIHDAAMVRLRRTSPGWLRSRAGRTLFAWVAPKAGPRHPNGLPVCVHLLEMKIGDDLIGDGQERRAG